MTAPPLTLYVHLPWCVRKCPYCDFNSHQLKSGLPDPAYIDALLKDFDLESPLVGERAIESVFFGGGTPSLFKPEAFAFLLDSLKVRANFAADAEITLEANPGAVERGAFTGYRDAGINRVSLGAQSFSSQALLRLGRIHSADETLRAVAELKAAGIVNVNLDLMYALPGQSLSGALADVQTACQLGPSHISHYQLTLEEGTAFHSRPPPLPAEDDAWEMQVHCQELLRERGYRQYEVSAYSRIGARCRHNLNYWGFGDYVGIGAGAHGKITVTAPARILRTSKPKQPREFQRRVMAATRAIGERRWVAIDELAFEYMLNSLRLNDGFAARDFESRTGIKMTQIRPQLEAAETRGLLLKTALGWRPSDAGRRFLNDLQAGFLK